MSDKSLDTADHDERATRLAALRERTQSDEYPETWVPTEQEPLIAGEFARLDHGNTRFGPCDIVVLRTEDGRERSVWLVHLALRNQFARTRPRPGDLLCIHWRGKRDSHDGNTYDDYRVEVDHGDGAPDWSALADGAPPASEPPAAVDPAMTRSHEHLPAQAPDESIPF